MKDKKNNIASYLFIGLMFTGGGIGMIFGRPEVGGAIGMGMGFLAMAAVLMFKKENQD